MIRLTLPYPISANRYWASRVIKAKATGKWMALTYITPEAKAYREEVALRVRVAGVREPLAGRVVLTIDLFPHRPQDWQTRMRKLGEAWDDSVQCIDLGNAEKVLSDALQGCAIGNDRGFWRIELNRREPDAAGARVEVTLAPLAVASRQADLLQAAA